VRALAALGFFVASVATAQSTFSFAALAMRRTIHWKPSSSRECSTA
jgi:hypothetical protein